MLCKVCSERTDFFARALILCEHSVAYYKCSACGFIQTEEPHWLEDAYASAITSSDVGLVRRNGQLAAVVKVLISLFFDANGYFLDYAGGYGLFVRHMRDKGFDFLWKDKYCNNIFAPGFEASEAGNEKIELVTAFELFEHFVEPVSDLEQILAYSRNVLFSTELLPEPSPQPDNWWYYGLEHGQHVGFHTRASLAALAHRFGLNFYTNGSSLHLFTDKQISQALFFVCARTMSAYLLGLFTYRKSLLEADFTKISGTLLKRNGLWK